MQEYIYRKLSIVLNYDANIIVIGARIKWFNDYDIPFLNTLLHATPKGVLHKIYPLWVVDDIRALFSVGIYYQSNPIAISQNI